MSSMKCAAAVLSVERFTESVYTVEALQLRTGEGPAFGAGRNASCRIWRGNEGAFPLALGNTVGRFICSAFSFGQANI